MNDRIFIVVAGTAALFVGFIVGVIFMGEAMNSSWREDCKVLQLHRHNGHVYECKQVKKDLS